MVLTFEGVGSRQVGWDLFTNSSIFLSFPFEEKPLAKFLQSNSTNFSTNAGNNTECYVIYKSMLPDFDNQTKKIVFLF